MCNPYRKCILRYSYAISYLELLHGHLEGRWQGKGKKKPLAFQNGEKLFRGDVNKSDQSPREKIKYSHLVGDLDYLSGLYEIALEVLWFCEELPVLCLHMGFFLSPSGIPSSFWRCTLWLGNQMYLNDLNTYLNYFCVLTAFSTCNFDYKPS